MSRHESVCPRCKQPMPQKMLYEGVYLPGQRAMIYEIVRDNPGITTDGIIAKLDNSSLNNVTLRQQIYQINNAMALTGVQISGVRPGKRGRYYIVRAEVAA